MILVIAEKPALGQAIADALPGSAINKNGTIIKGNYTVVWAFGHLLALKNPEDYDKKYEKWNLSDLPIYFPNWENKIKPDPKDKKSGQQSISGRVRQIGDLLKEADMVIHAGDNDEEGQLLIDELLRWHKYKGPVKRLDTADTSTEALRKALKNMKDNKEEEINGWSAYARMVADGTFGFNLSRYYTVINKSKTPLTTGRVQTAALGLVVNRDKIIESHEKTVYYELFSSLNVKGKVIETKYIPNPEDPNLTEGKFLNKKYLEEKGKWLHGRQLDKIIIRKKAETEAAPLPFNLNTLNTYCEKKWGLNPDDVMKITQSLRENYKAITYNRSDCQYLSDEHFKEAPVVVNACTKNLGMSASVFDTNRKSRCFDNDKITAHFAIIPTNETFDIGRLSEDEKRVYDAIAKYYLAQFLPPAQKEKTILETALTSGEKLRASATKIVMPGYLSILKEDDKDKNESNENKALCEFVEGVYQGVCIDCAIKEKETKPPSRYTQTTLFNDMGCIAKYVDDPEIKQLLLLKDKEKKGENGSIGTVATRGMIIKRLITVGYLTEKQVSAKKTVLISTPKGRAFYNMLPEEIKKADVTAKWWVIQEDIKLGKATPETLTLSVLDTVKKIIESGEGKIAEELVNSGAQEVCKCPNCKETMLIGKFGPYCKAKCGFSQGYAFGKKLTEKQAVVLCSGKKVLIKGIAKKDGSGTFDAYAVPSGVEEYTVEKDGVKRTAYRLKLQMQFKKK